MLSSGERNIDPVRAIIERVLAPSAAPHATLWDGSSERALPLYYTWWKKPRYSTDSDFSGIQDRWESAPVLRLRNAESSEVVRIYSPTVPFQAYVTSFSARPTGNSAPEHMLSAEPSPKTLGAAGGTLSPGSIEIRQISDGANRWAEMTVPRDALGPYTVISANWRVLGNKPDTLAPEATAAWNFRVLRPRG